MKKRVLDIRYFEWNEHVRLFTGGRLCGGFEFRPLTSWGGNGLDFPLGAAPCRGFMSAGGNCFGLTSAGGNCRGFTSFGSVGRLSTLASDFAPELLLGFVGGALLSSDFLLFDIANFRFSSSISRRIFSSCLFCSSSFLRSSSSWSFAESLDDDGPFSGGLSGTLRSGTRLNGVVGFARLFSKIEPDADLPFDNLGILFADGFADSDFVGFVCSVELVDFVTSPFFSRSLFSRHSFSLRYSFICFFVISLSLRSSTFGFGFASITTGSCCFFSANFSNETKSIGGGPGGFFFGFGFSSLSGSFSLSGRSFSPLVSWSCSFPVADDDFRFRRCGRLSSNSCCFRAWRTLSWNGGEFFYLLRDYFFHERTDIKENVTRIEIRWILGEY